MFFKNIHTYVCTLSTHVHVYFNTYQYGFHTQVKQFFTHHLLIMYTYHKCKLSSFACRHLITCSQAFTLDYAYVNYLLVMCKSHNYFVLLLVPLARLPHGSVTWVIYFTGIHFTGQSHESFMWSVLWVIHLMGDWLVSTHKYILGNSHVLVGG